MNDHDGAVKLSQQKAQMVNELEAEKARLENQVTNVARLADRYKREANKANAQAVDAVRMEEKKGEIVRREDGGFVVINIGSSKKLRPQVTFLVVSSGVSWLTLLEKEDALQKGRYDLNRQPFEGNPYVKAGIEVVDVTGPDTARAKILFENEPIRNPVRSHDQIFNLAWEPSEEIRIAFGGIIDLDGDGLDNNEEFLRMLERQGIIVDEYLRLKPLAFIKRDGKGMTLQTRYLVMAADPQIDPLAPDKGSPRQVQAQKVLEQMSEMRLRAKELGVQLIDANKFLAMTGFKLPKKPLPPQYGAGVYLESPPVQQKKPGDDQ
jgi:hypothetical protein